MIKKVPENWETLAKYPFKIKLIAEFDWNLTNKLKTGTKPILLYLKFYAYNKKIRLTCVQDSESRRFQPYKNFCYQYSF